MNPWRIACCAALVVCAITSCGCWFIGPGPLAPLPPGRYPAANDYVRDPVCEACVAAWKSEGQRAVLDGVLDVSLSETRQGTFALSVNLRHRSPMLWIRGRIDLVGASAILRYRKFVPGDLFDPSAREPLYDIHPVGVTRVPFSVLELPKMSEAKEGSVLFSLIFEIVQPGETEIAVRDVSYGLEPMEPVRTLHEPTALARTLELKPKKDS